MSQLEYCKPISRNVVPTGPDWIHEVKYDGYRGRIIRDGKDVKLLSRSGLDWTWRFPWIVETALKIRQTRFLVDGEICVLDVQGISDFNALHSNRHNEEAQLYAFDLLALDGDDLRDLPLVDRKSRLAKLLHRRPEGIFVAPFEQGEIGPSLVDAACRMNLKGLVSKHRERPYRPRTCGWVKVKNRKHPAFSRVMDQF
jgi:bifunctional non-homologous end joining protein LigD